MKRKAMTMALGAIVVYSVLMTLFNQTFRNSRVTASLSTSYNVSTSAQPLTLITLFTTFQYYKDKIAYYRNTIRIWGQLVPFVRPVLYYVHGENYLAEFARKHGWSVYKCPRVSRGNMPVLRSMFLHAQTINETTPFYGYANGDILFDSNLVTTLEAVNHARNRFKQIFVIGQRIDYNFTRNQELRNLSTVSLLASAGKLHPSNAQDYFITTHSGFPWESIPDFVVGRVGYDNWLVATAINRNFSVIDVTATVTALHQTGRDGNAAGRNVKRDFDEKHINYHLAGKFDYSDGITTLSNYITLKPDSKVYIIKRPFRLIFPKKFKRAIIDGRTF